MWATVAVGGYDNVFLLIGSGEQAPCIMWLTLAMLCVTQCQAYPVWSSVGMVFCLACSSLTWGLGLAMAPAVLVQFYLLESPSLRSSGLRWKWFLMWAGVVGLIALVHLVLRAVNQDPTTAGAMAWNMPWRFVVQFAAAFGNLIGFSHSQASSSIALKVTLVTLLLAAAFFYGGNSRRVLCVFLAATVGYVAVLVVFRADRDLFDGRYLYVPSLLWCVVAGVFVGGVYRHRRALGRKLLVACVMLAGLLHVYHQRAIAGEARAQFDQYLTITEETLEGYKALLVQLEQQAQLSGNAVRLPDFPIVVPPNFYPTYFPFSAWVAVVRDELPQGVELLEPDELTPQEIESAATFLESLDLLQARQAAHALRTAVPDSRSLMWLSEFAQQHEIVILVPNFTFAYPELNLSYPVIQCLSNAFDQSLPGLRVVSVDDVPKAELSQQLELLEASPDREAMFQWAGGFGGLALCGLLGSCSRSTNNDRVALSPPVPSKAKHVVFLYMDGGPSQMDTFDPKPRLDKDHGKPIAMAKVPETQFRIGNMVMKSPYKFKQHGQCGAWVSDIFPEVATCVDDLAIIRSMVAENSEHTAANYFMNTGWPIAGRPSMGAWVTYAMGSECDELPGYVVLDTGQMPLGGVECFSNGFLPPMYQGTLLHRGNSPVPDIRPLEPSTELQTAKLELIQQLNERHRKRMASLGSAEQIEAVIANYETAAKMQLAVPDLTDISDETEATRQLYGLDRPETEEFGRQCLLTRRLIERGVRFIQLLPPSLPDHNHWDQHTKLARYHRSNAQAVDRPIAGLLKDLKQRGMLNETLVIFGGEFGRTPMAQEMPHGEHGRDHNPFGFTMWMAGGGIQPGLTYGATDEYGYFAVENPVHVHDLHATILHQLGQNHEQLTYHHGGRDYRLTDVYGEVVHDLII
ncbi:unnamed protein product [Cladocopium goreaui]|uniref:DUF1501 domain-containing protein n=1 Tax=Cladocopium goreaui TaxID=2562237 RepID=A0A9P1BGC8_9DINO|nr:unnamed protein product [Cladocopium goreaui]